MLGTRRGGTLPNGRPGDHPLTDLLVHGMHPFPEDMEKMLREILALDPDFPDGRRPYAEGVEWMKMFGAWARGEQLDEGRESLRLVLDELSPGAGA